MFRIPPNLPAGAYQTYQVLCPPDRYVVAACEQVGCRAWLYGWASSFRESVMCSPEPVPECLWIPQGQPPCGRCAAQYVRTKSGRTFREMRGPEGLTIFQFEPKQRCFAEHRTRPESFLVRGGDWRQNLGVVRQHTRPADWVEDFGEHQQRIADQQQKG